MFTFPDFLGLALNEPSLVVRILGTTASSVTPSPMTDAR
jgi:hypothetical protein